MKTDTVIDSANKLYRNGNYSEAMNELEAHARFLERVIVEAAFLIERIGTTECESAEYCQMGIRWMNQYETHHKPLNRIP